MGQREGAAGSRLSSGPAQVGSRKLALSPSPQMNWGGGSLFWGGGRSEQIEE